MKLIYFIFQKPFVKKIFRYKLSLEKVLPQTSQLYVQIGRITLSNSLSIAASDFLMKFISTTKENVRHSPSTLAQFLDVYFEIPIVCYNSSQVWI